MIADPTLILLVDDNDDDNYIHRRAIKKSGLNCQVDVCSSGDIAMDYLTNQGEYASRGTDFRLPDVVFLDINMPRVDGWEFLELYAEWVESNQIKPSTVIVMLSTSVQLSDIERANKTPYVTQYIKKPLQPDGIIEVISGHFPKAVA